MEVSMFEVELKRIEQVDGNILISIPILNAYFLSNLSVIINGFNHVVLDHDRSKDGMIKIGYNLDSEDKIFIVLFHYGVSNYELLFPFIYDINEKVRVASFCREADLAFKAESWMSFGLMCGAVLEGVIYAVLENRRALPKKVNFNQLIEKILEIGMINETEYHEIHQIRNQRNNIHAKKKGVIDRKLAMSMKAIFDRIILRFSYM